MALCVPALNGLMLSLRSWSEFRMAFTVSTLVIRLLSPEQSAVLFPKIRISIPSAEKQAGSCTRCCCASGPPVPQRNLEEILHETGETIFGVGTRSSFSDVFRLSEKNGNLSNPGSPESRDVVSITTRCAGN